MSAKRIEGEVTEIKFVTWEDFWPLDVHVQAVGKDEDLGWHHLHGLAVPKVDGKDVTAAELVAFLHHGGPHPKLPRCVLVMDEDKYAPCESAEFFSS